MNVRTITVFVGRWNDRDFVFSLDKDKAISLVKAHFSFGDPAEDEYAAGNCWAEGDNDIGWRIIERKVTVPVIGVHLKTEESTDTSHVAWQCPYCGKAYSDEWQSGEVPPYLLSCGCENASEYLLGDQINEG